jgi:hypothetical protein
MSQVMILKDSRPDIGLYMRNATLGDEYALVEQFIDYYCSIFLRDNKKTQLAVFVEPRIDSGFPDVVFASYLPSILDNWSYERERLDIFDLKLLSYLSNRHMAKGAKIIARLGFSEKQTITSLEKLMDAKLVSYRSYGWCVRELRDVFSIKKLIAVEAKLNDVSRVVDQSFINTRFASHSYALTNAVNPNNKTMQIFSKYGVGLYCKDLNFKKCVEAKTYILPSSYLSYQFNEWIGRAITHKGYA